MLKRKRHQQSEFSAIENSKTIVNDFCLRHPYESYRTVDYYTYSKLEESVMIPILDAHINKLLAGDVDEANGNMLNSIIVSVAGEAQTDLERQHCEHTDTLHRLILRHDTDMEDIQRLKEAREAELETIKHDYEKICNMLKNEREVI